ncbi:MAG: phosphoribosylformylglycinamidine synthase subunit PurS, partial [Ktedonobacteraceae bacterium]
MNFYFIEVRATASQHDVQARKLTAEIRHLPTHVLPSLSVITAGKFPLLLRTAQLYQITGNLSSTQVDLLTRQLLVDPVVQEARIFRAASAADTAYVVDVFFHPGVTDTLAESVLTGAQLLGVTDIAHVETGRRYTLDSRLQTSEARFIAESLLYNPVIQQYALHGAHTTQADFEAAPTLEASEVQPTDASGQVAHISLTTMSDEVLLEVSKSGLLALDLHEMRTIQSHFRELGREPTDVELETLAQTWSEHCSHKTFRATINYREVDRTGQIQHEETIPN